MATVYKAVAERRGRLPAHRRDQAHQARVPRAQELRRHVHRGGARRLRARAPEHRPGPRLLAQDGSYYLVMEWVEGIDLGALHSRASRQRASHVAVAARRSRSASARCAGSAPRTIARARRRAGAGDPSRRLAAQRAARRQRRRQAHRLRPRARARSRREHDRARHREGQAAATSRPRSRSASRTRCSRICSASAACCGRRCPASACSTARPTSRSSRRSARARCRRSRSAGPTCRPSLAAVLDVALAADPANRYRVGDRVRARARRR